MYQPDYHDIYSIRMMDPNTPQTEEERARAVKKARSHKFEAKAKNGADPLTKDGSLTYTDI